MEIKMTNSKSHPFLQMYAREILVLAFFYQDDLKNVIEQVLLNVHLSIVNNPKMMGIETFFIRQKYI